MTDTTAPSTGRDAKVLALIGSGHALSHFYLLALPPLFPILKDAFGVSYAALGLLIAALNLTTAAAQVPAGMLIDRIGARGVLMAGLTLMGLSMGLIGLAPSYGVALVLVCLAGLGNSAFHPADYAILAASVDPSRLGRAFSLHTFSGNVGFTAAPAAMIGLTALFGWRAALVVAGCLALAALPAFAASGALLRDAAAGRGQEAAVATRPGGGLAPLLTPPILMLFLFFVSTAMVTSGVQSFSVAALGGFHGLDLAGANTVLTGFLFAAAIGVLAGGVVADRTRRHATVTAAAMCLAAALFLLLGTTALPFAVLFAAFALIGLLQGCVRPARDMMVKAATPEGAAGRVFGFVSTGLNVGSALTPALIGYVLDRGEPRLVFLLLGLFVLLGLGTLGALRRPHWRRAHQPANSRTSKPRLRSIR